MKLDDIKKLHQRKYREQFGHYLVEGEHLILELQKAVTLGKVSNAEQIRLFVTEKYAHWQGAFTTTVISEKQMSRLSDTKTPQGILACVPLSNSAATPNPPSPTTNEKYFYLHEVQDPGNLGTILRSLAWFSGFRVLLSPNSVDPYNSKAVRASMGAIFHVPIEQDIHINTLCSRFETIAYLDITGESIKSPNFSNYTCYLFGNEARGVPKKDIQTLNANAFTIPGDGKLESLNLASAVAISAFALSV